MKATEILQLINAGYTKADIEAMELPETAAVPDPEPSPAPAAEPEPVKDAPTPEPERPNTVNPDIQALTKQINDLVSAIQKSNLLNTNQPQVPAESAEDILANIIAPTHKRAGQ
jgi:hypothetical protein